MTATCWSPPTRVPGLAELTGTWERSSLTWSDGTRDTTTEVTWVQAGRWFADLRIPADRAGTGDGGEGGRDGVVAFAGALSVEPDDPSCFRWTRCVDLPEPDPVPDRARLALEGPVLFERGCDRPYLEVWHRASPADLATSALVLRDDESGRFGLLLRGGTITVLVRDRAAGDFGDVDAAAAGEIAFLTGPPNELTVSRSNLPGRRGARLAVTTDDIGVVIEEPRTGDQVSRRRWAIRESAAHFTGA